MKILELKIPPVLVFIICCFAIYVADSWALFQFSLPFPWLFFIFCFVASGYFGLSGILEFKKAKTTVHPVHIHKTATVVDSGVYRLTRNPMYLALLLLLLGYGYLQQNLLSLFVSVLFVLYMNRFQIQPEEIHMQQKFTTEYDRYKKKVRRWI